MKSYLRFILAPIPPVVFYCAGAALVSGLWLFSAFLLVVGSATQAYVLLLVETHAHRQGYVKGMLTGRSYDVQV